MAAILLGAENLSDSNNFSAAGGGGGLVEGFWGSLVFSPLSVATSATRTLMNSNAAGPARGWDIRTTAANALISMAFQDNTNVTRASGTGALGASALGKIHVWSWCWDAPALRWRSYFARAEIGSGVAVTGYAPSPGAIQLGRALAGSLAASDLRVFGFCIGEGVPTLARFQSQFDAIMADDGAIHEIPGMTTMLVDITADVRDNGGVMPATLTDRIGANDMTRNGAPAVGAQYARAFGW